MSVTKQPESSTRLELLAALCACVNEATAVKPLLEASLAAASDLMHFDTGWIYLRDETRRYVMAAAHALPAPLDADGQARLRWGPCRCQSMLDAGELVAPVNIVDCERLGHADAAQGLAEVAALTGGLVDHASVPLKVPGRALGLLNLAWRGGAPLSAEDVSLLSLVGHVVSAGLLRVQTHERAEADRARERQVLGRLAEQLAGLAEPSAIAAAAAVAVRGAIKVDGLSVFVPDPAGTHLQAIAGEGWMKDGVADRRLPLHPPRASAPAWCFHAREVIFGDVGDPRQPFSVPDDLRAAGVRTCVHVPLVLGERTLGVLTATRLTQAPFSPEEARFISLCCGLASVALQGAIVSESMRAIVQHLPVPTIVVDLDGKVREWNPAAEQVFGWTRDQAVGHDPPHVPVERWEDYEERRRHVLSGEIVRGVEVRRRRKDGRPVEVSLWAAPIRDAAGRITGTMGFLIDMTELRRAKEAVRSSTVQMERLSRRVLDAHEDERRSIARELHDEVGQALTALSLLLGTVARSGEVAKLTEAQTLVTEAIERVRDLSLDLRPALLDDAGLVPALVWHIERYSARTGVQVMFTHAGVEGRRFGSAVENAVYRIAQEALTNVARHASVGRASVRLSADQGIIVLLVNDEGVGFDPDTLPPAASSGLEGMRERTALLSGRTTILSAPGAGTRVQAVIPLD